MLSAGFTALVALLDANDAGNLAGERLSNDWLILIGIAAFVGLGGWEYAKVVNENYQLKQTRPKLSLTLPENRTLGVLDSGPFSVGVSNGPNVAASLHTRIFVEGTSPSPTSSNVPLPSALAHGGEDIGPNETTHFGVLSIQRGSRAGGPTFHAVMSFFAGPVFIDLIHGPEKNVIRYKATSTNSPSGIDFFCVITRRVSRNEFLWDVEWGLGQSPDVN